MTEKKKKYIYININIFEIYFFIYFFILFIYFLLLLFSGTQLRICVQVATPLALVNALLGLWLSSLVPEGRGDEMLWGRSWFLLTLARMSQLPLPRLRAVSFFS